MMTMSSLASPSSQDDSAASPTYVEFNVKSHHRPLACLSHVDTPRVCALGNPSRDVVHEAPPDTSANQPLCFPDASSMPHVLSTEQVGTQVIKG